MVDLPGPIKPKYVKKAETVYSRVAPGRPQAPLYPEPAKGWLPIRKPPKPHGGYGGGDIPTPPAPSYTYHLVAASGQFELLGRSVTFSWNLSGPTYTLTAASGAFALTGYSATLTYTTAGGPVPTYTLVAGPGSFTMQGDFVAYVLTAGSGSFGLTGYPAALTYTSSVTTGLLDEDGQPILDEDGQPLLDET